MCLSRTEQNETICAVKFANRSKKVITNLDYVLQYMVINDDSVHSVEEIKPRKLKLKIIDKYDKKDKDAKYAVRISYAIPNIEEQKQQSNVKWIFTVIAQDPASGSTTCVSQEFLAENIVWGQHQTEGSLNFLSSKKHSLTPTS